MKDLIDRSNVLKNRLNEFKLLYVVSGNLAVLKQTARDGTVSYYCSTKTKCVMPPYYLPVYLFVPVSALEAGQVQLMEFNQTVEAISARPGGLRIHEDELGVTFEAEWVTKFCSDRMLEINCELRPLLRQIKKAKYSP